MHFRTSTLAALLLAWGMGAAQAGATTEVGYATLAGAPISFSELADGAVIDGILISGGVQFGERFDGQELAVTKAPRPGAVAQDWFDDLSFGAPLPGLTLLPGAIGANLGVFHYADTDGAAIFGIGPQNSDGSDPSGFGALSARFTSPVSALGFQLRDADGGAITLQLYRADGSLIEAVDLSSRTDGRYAFARNGGVADIAGFSLTHVDAYYGVSLDNLLLATAPVPEPAAALLFIPGLLTLAALRRRAR